MSVELEFCSLIIPIEVIRKYYPGGYKKYKLERSHIFVPENFNIWFDDDLVREGSMGSDFDDKIHFWEELGVKTNKGDKAWEHPCVVAFTDPGFCKQLVFHEAPIAVSLRKKSEKSNNVGKNTMRKLSQEFMADLKTGGILSPICETVKSDKDLIMEIRDDYVDVYYRGGRIFELKRQENEYTAGFDIDYAKNHPKQKEVEKKLEDNKITTLDDANKWVGNIRSFKEIMDHHFNTSTKEDFEKHVQQLIVQENNLIRISESTDYFIIDFEYQANFEYQGEEKIETRFDLVGLFWDRKDRKNPKGCKLAIIEVKYGDKELDDDKNGLTAHIIKTEKFMDDKEREKSFREEMIGIFKQKRELGLLNIKNLHEVPIEALDEQIEFLFIIAGHNTRSSVLGKELSKLEDELGKKNFNLKKENIRFATSSFTGYALFKENMKSLSYTQILLPYDGFTEIFRDSESGSWRYQAVYVEHAGEKAISKEYSICEVHLDKDDKLRAWTENYHKGAFGDDLDGLIASLQLMMDDIRLWKAVPYNSLKEGMVFERT